MLAALAALVAAAEAEVAEALVLVAEADVDAADAESLLVAVADALVVDVVVVAWLAALEVSVPETAEPMHCVSAKITMAAITSMAMTIAAILPPLRCGAGWNPRGFLDWAE